MVIANVDTLPPRWQRGVSLARLTTWRIGGPAAFVSHPRDRQELRDDLELAARLALPVFAIGAGSNLLFPDDGYPGLLVRLPSGGVTAADGGALPSARESESDAVRARCPAGAPLPRVVRRLARLGWAGLEWAEGIPGTVGGAVVNNAGAFGGQIASALDSAEVWMPPDAPLAQSAADLGLAYRHSRLKGDEPTRAFILSACFRLERGRPDELAACMAEIRARRRQRAPREPSCGSVFRNPPGCAAGKLIAQAGLMGMRIGGAQISTRHANYIVNRGAASAAEVLELIALTRERVRATSGIELELEVQMVGFAGKR